MGFILKVTSSISSILLTTRGFGIGILEGMFIGSITWCVHFNIVGGLKTGVEWTFYNLNVFIL